MVLIPRIEAHFELFCMAKSRKMHLQEEVKDEKQTTRSRRLQVNCAVIATLPILIPRN
ncbi:MAG: hypothetical protein Q6366_008945 [Candidatus Freyarchaeota archaeon]